MILSRKSLGLDRGVIMEKKQPVFSMLNVNEIELDIDNPRIAMMIEMRQGEITAEDIMLALGVGSGRGESLGTSYLSLKESIKTNSGIIHPIIVNKTGPDKYTVIEGNTRVQIYRELKNDKVKGNWDMIPSMVYDNLDQATIDAIRLQAHLVGPRDWDPYSKGKYLNFLYSNENLTLAQIVDFCGGNKTEVNNYIKAYNDMESHYRPLLDSDDEFDPTRFSAFVELQKSTIRQSIVSNGFTVKDFSQWIIDGKIGPLQNVRSLPRVLSNPKSREVFLKENISEALKVLAVPTTAIGLADASIEQLAAEICKKIANAPYEYIKKLRSGSLDDAKDIIIESKEMLISLCQDIESGD